MASAPTSEEFDPLISYTTICERQRHALRLFAGRSKRFSATELGAGSGVSWKRIYAATRPLTADDYRLLRQEEVASIAKFLTGEGVGHIFVSALLEPSGLGAFELMGGQPPLNGVLSSADTSLTRDERIARIRLDLAEIEMEDGR